VSIWFKPFDIRHAQERSANTLLSHLDIQFIDVGDSFLKASMPVDHRTHQPLGIMHGGASCVLAESVGSTAANYCVDPERYYCVGLDINTNHIRSVKSGLVIATASPYHIGRSTHVWHIEIHDENTKLISVNRLTMAVLNKK
jgi:uncharacterized protein (TIGR00369 family)